MMNQKKEIEPRKKIMDSLNDLENTLGISDDNFDLKDNELIPSEPKPKINDKKDKITSKNGHKISRKHNNNGIKSSNNDISNNNGDFNFINDNENNNWNDEEDGFDPNKYYMSDINDKSRKTIIMNANKNDINNNTNNDDNMDDELDSADDIQNMLDDEISELL